jgi:hypothetical protein
MEIIARPVIRLEHNLHATTFRGPVAPRNHRIVLPDGRLIDQTVYIGEKVNLLSAASSRNKFLKFGRYALRDILGYPLLGAQGQVPQYIAVGLDGTTTVDGMTALGGEVFRKLCTGKFPGDCQLTIQTYVDTTEANGSTGEQVLKEVGLFCTPALQGAWARAVTAGITKNSSVSIIYNWVLTIYGS